MFGPFEVTAPIVVLVEDILARVHPIAPTEGEAVVFQADGSDSDGNITRLEWLVGGRTVEMGESMTITFDEPVSRQWVEYAIEGRVNETADSGVVVIYKIAHETDAPVTEARPIEIASTDCPNFRPRPGCSLKDPGDTAQEKVSLLNPVIVEFELVGERGTDLGYHATVNTSMTGGWSNMVIGSLSGAVQAGSSDVPGLTAPNGTTPDMDLVAIDSQGRRVGVTSDGRYVNEIPGARTSGDRTAGLEWIAVPDDTDVRFMIRSDDVARFVAESNVSAENVSARFRTSVTRYGANPRVTTDDGEFTVTNATVHASDNRSLAPGETTTAVQEPVFVVFESTPRRPTSNQTVTFDAGLSFGLNTSITTYEWTFGDGTTATGERVTHAYTDAGTYRVRLTVTDTAGRTNTTRQRIRVRARSRAPDATGDGAPARDPDGDGRFEDVNGDGSVTPGDATVLFEEAFAV